MGELDKLQQEYDVRTAIPHKVDEMRIRLHLQANSQTDIHQGKVFVESRVNHSFGESLYEGKLAPRRRALLLKAVDQLPHEFEPIRTDVLNVFHYCVLLLSVSFLKRKHYLSEELIMLP